MELLFVQSRIGFKLDIFSTLLRTVENLYRTMRNVEKAIEKNINRSSLDVSCYEEESSRDRETAEKMFEEANEEYGGGW